MKIAEIFYSIQGEGRYMGLPAIFCRLQGCSLRCPFCDSNQTWDDEHTKDLTVDEVVGRIMRESKFCKLVIITGGEPTEQIAELYELVSSLKYEGYRCHLETNGTHDVAGGYFEWVVCSPKEKAGYSITPHADELKYVIKAGDDLNSIIPGYVRDKWARRIWLQPMANGNEIVAENVEYCYKACMRDPRLRLGFQFHKYLRVR